MSHNVTSKSQVSLIDLTALVLCRFLPKNAGIQVCNSWDEAELSEAHVQYAMMDAFATWSIYEVLVNGKTGTAVTESTPAGTPI